MKSQHRLLVAALTVSLGVPLALVLGQNPGFVPGGRDILSLSFAGTAPGSLPAGVRVSGNLQVVDKDGVRMLRASSRSELLLQLPEVLPQDFTLEFDLIPKTCCNPEDLAFEGTTTISQSSSSANVLWHREHLVVLGGGDSYQATMRADLRDQLPGQFTTVAASFEGNTLKLYTNGQRLFTLTDRYFVRGRVLRVFLGGQDDDQQAVYLARIRVATGPPAPVVAVTVPATQTGTITPMTAAQQTPSSGALAPRPSSGVQVLGNGPAPTGLTITGTPTTASLKWSAVPGAVGYKVIRALAGTMTPTTLTAAPITATVFPGDVVPDRTKTYTYQVLAYQADGTYGVATADFLAPNPRDPDQFRAVSSAPGVVELQWASVAGATAYLVTGPGIPPGTQVSGAVSFTVPAVSPGPQRYRVATVYAPGGVMTAPSSWPITSVVVPPPTMLIMHNGHGSLAEYNLHACNAGKWIATQQVWPNTWCDVPTAQSAANVRALPWLSLFEIQEFQFEQGKDFITGAAFDIFVPAHEWTTYNHWRWGKSNRIVPEAVFDDVTDLGRVRRVGCVERGTGAEAATLCWALSIPGHLSVIIKTQQEMFFLLFQDVPEQPVTTLDCPKPNWGGDWTCAKLLGRPTTQLDSRGERFAPHTCLACHGGRFDPATGKVTGASLLPLDPRGFEFDKTHGRGGMEETIRQVNMAVFNSNPAPAVRDYITHMYRGRQAVLGATVDDAFVPPGWVDQPGLYRDVYRPYCATCHNTQTGGLDFLSWGDLVREKVRVQRAVCGYTMPHAEVPFKKFWAHDGPARLPDVLLAALGYPPC